MRLFTVCVVAVLLWAGADALAQGKGKGKDEPARVKEDAAKANKPQQEFKAVEKDTAKGNKAAKDLTSAESKQGGPQGKKAEKLDDAVGKGKAGQQLQSMQKQLQHEQAKHMERQARLARIRELAVQKGDTETVARVDKLMQKQQQVFDRKLQHLQGQKRATQQPGAAGKEGTTAPAEPNATGNPPSVPEASKPTEVSGGNAAGNHAGKDHPKK